jgi:hypothetical protein
MNSSTSARLLLCLCVIFAGCSAVGSPATTAEELRKIEESRLRALVRGDAAGARELHADDFQLITPFGMTIGREAYLGGIANNQIDYHLWQPGPIEVRLFPGAAVLRYQAEVEISFRGNRLPRQRLWHTDLYEFREDRWQVVWSQATEIRE